MTHLKTVWAKLTYSLAVTGILMVGLHLGLQNTMLGDCAFSVFLFLAVFAGSEMFYARRPFRSWNFWVGLGALICILVFRLFLDFLAVLAVTPILFFFTLMRFPRRSSVGIARENLLRAEANLHHFIKYVRERDEDCTAEYCRELWTHIPLETRVFWADRDDYERKCAFAEAGNRLRPGKEVSS